MGKPQPNGKRKAGVLQQRPLHRGSVMEAPGTVIAKKDDIFVRIAKRATGSVDTWQIGNMTANAPTPYSQSSA